MGDKVYDIFISCKEKNDEGERTVSSFIAEKIYNSLCIKGYNAFCSRRVLPGMAGTEYKPKIRQAMETSKLLVLVYTCAEEVVSNWVREEWMFFLSNKKPVLPVFMKQGIVHDYLMPHEISKLEHINLTDDKTGDMYELMLNRIDSIMSEFVNEIIADSHDVKEGKSFSKGNQKTTDSQSVEAESLFELGEMYADFDGEKHDYKKAFECFIKAANLNYAEAFYRIGYMYENGFGVNQNFDKAFKWHTKAANAGNSHSMILIATFYHHGLGVPQDDAKVIEWFTKAADAGDSDAMFNLGNMYYYGEGVRQDYAKAVEWYAKAADTGNSDAMCCLGTIYENGEGVSQDYTKSIEWYIKGIDAGNTEAMNHLGAMYKSGQGVIKDYAKAIEWFTKAADAGNSNAMLNLSIMYTLGQGVIQDYAKAYEWITKAAETGDSNAIEQIE